MTLTTTSGRNDATGSGSTATYPFGFKIFLASDLRVTILDLTGQQSTLVLNTDYTVSGVGSSSGGSISLVNNGQAWIDSNGFFKTGYDITIRNVPVKNQLTDIKNQGAYFPESIEAALDKLVMVSQQMQDEIDRSIKASETDYTAALTLPNSSTRAGQYLAFDGSGSPTVSSGIPTVPVSSFMGGVVASADATSARTILGSSVDLTTVLTTAGALLMKNSANTAISALNPGLSGQVLGISSGIPSFQYPSVSAKLINYTLTNADETVTFDANSASLVATLPTAVGIAGKTFTIKRIDNTANTVTVNTTSAQTLDGRASGDIVLKVKNDYVRVQSDGANWIILAKKETAFVTSNTFKAFSGTGSGNYGSGSPSITLGPGHWRVTGQFAVAEAAYSTAGLSLATGIFASDGSNTSATPTALSGVVLGDNTFNSLVSGNIGLAPYIGTAQNSCAVSGLIEIELIQTTSQTLYLVPVPNYSGSASGGSNQMITARRIW